MRLIDQITTAADKIVAALINNKDVLIKLKKDTSEIKIQEISYKRIK